MISIMQLIFVVSCRNEGSVKNDLECPSLHLLISKNHAVWHQLEHKSVRTVLSWITDVKRLFDLIGDLLYVHHTAEHSTGTEMTSLGRCAVKNLFHSTYY